MHRTKTDAALAEAEASHADDPERAELLRRARRFKTSWIELAEALTQAKRGGRWTEWCSASRSSARSFARRWRRALPGPSASSCRTG